MRSLLVASVLILGAPRLAGAQPSSGETTFSASLEYTAPAGCPSTSDFKAVVIGRLGFDPFSEKAPHRVQVAIAPGASALEGRIEWRDASGAWTGDQTFPARTRDCADLARAMGFALAVQINLLTTRQSAETTSPAAEEPSSEPRDTADQTLSPAESEDTRSDVDRAPDDDSEAGDSADDTRRGARWLLGVGAGGALAVGSLPGPIALVRVFGSLSKGRAALELGAEMSSVSRDSREDGAGFNERAFLASAALCGSEAPLTVCLLGKVGAVKVSGENLDVPATSSGTAAQLGLRAGLRQLAGSVFFAERVEGLVNISRATVTIDGLPVWTAPRFAGALGLDVGFIFH